MFLLIIIITIIATTTINLKFLSSGDTPRHSDLIDQERIVILKGCQKHYL